MRIYERDLYFGNNRKCSGFPFFFICGTETKAHIPHFQIRLSSLLVSRCFRTPLHSQFTDKSGFRAQKKRVMGIEPTYPAWKAGVLPLNYTRIISDTSDILPQRQKECKLFLYFYSTFLLLLVKHHIFTQPFYFCLSNTGLPNMIDKNIL